MVVEMLVFVGGLSVSQVKMACDPDEVFLLEASESLAQGNHGVLPLP